MRNKILALALALFLAGCGTTHTITQTQTIVITPAAALYVCPDLPPLPGAKATDADVAHLITGLANTAITCKSSLNAVKKNIQDQADIVNSTRVKPTSDD